ncbi:MAG: CDP-diacylglycerol--glycerol-3-phosphate 3-phosphatidyltransferase, partial [Gemmatimonadota bacterium]
MLHPALTRLPNLLTLSRIAATPVFVALLLADGWIWRSLAFAVFVAAALTDYYDGFVARAHDEVTDFGSFMDPLADKILVISALAALAAARVVHLWIVVPIALRDAVVTAMRLHGICRGRRFVTSRLAKVKTMIQLCAIALVVLLTAIEKAAGHFGGPLASLPAGWLPTVSNILMG